jgi:hypothetical protein
MSWITFVLRGVDNVAMATHGPEGNAETARVRGRVSCAQPLESHAWPVVLAICSRSSGVIPKNSKPDRTRVV